MPMRMTKLFGTATRTWTIVGVHAVLAPSDPPVLPPPPLTFAQGRVQLRLQVETARDGQVEAVETVFLMATGEAAMLAMGEAGLLAPALYTLCQSGHVHPQGQKIPGDAELEAWEPAPPPVEVPVPPIADGWSDDSGTEPPRPPAPTDPRPTIH